MKIGSKHSKETKLKMSISHKGKIRSEEHRNNLSKAKMGHGTSAETRKKIGDAHRGMKYKMKNESKAEARYREKNKYANEKPKFKYTVVQYMEATADVYHYINYILPPRPKPSAGARFKGDEIIKMVEDKLKEKYPEMEGENNED